MKKKTIIIRVEETVFKEYKELCIKNGFNLSQRIRNYINNEIKALKHNV